MSKQLFHTTIAVVVCGLHWHSLYDFSGMEWGWVSALPCHTCCLIILLRLRLFSVCTLTCTSCCTTNCPFLVWYMFFKWWYFLVYILFLSHISNSLPVFYACYNSRMSIVSTRYVTFLCYLSIRLQRWLAMWVIWCIMGLVAQSFFFFSLPKPYPLAKTLAMLKIASVYNYP